MVIAERLGGIKSGGAIFVETFIGVSPFRLPFKLSQFTSKFAPLAAHTANCYRIIICSLYSNKV